MFCSKCGVKLSQKSGKCPNCGACVPEDEYCGGFWGLVNGNGQPAAGKTESLNNEGQRQAESRQQENRISEREQKALNKYKRNIKNLLITTAVLAVIVIAELIAIVMLAAGFGGNGGTETAEGAGFMTGENSGEPEGAYLGFAEKETAPPQEQTTEETTAEVSEEETEEPETVQIINNGEIFQNDKKEEMEITAESGAAY